MQKEKDRMFVLVEASQLSINDDFMKYDPTTDKQREFKKLLTKAIRSGVSDFLRPKLDPSRYWEWGKLKLIFEPNRSPAVLEYNSTEGFVLDPKHPSLREQIYYSLEMEAKRYLPERGSRIGTPTEYVVFLGVLIKKLISSGWSVSAAWYAVCDNSCELGHYLDSKNGHQFFEKTGSRQICGFCDLANTYKLLFDEDGVLYVAGGYYWDFSSERPLASLTRRDKISTYRYWLSTVDLYGVSVPWLVLSK